MCAVNSKKQRGGEKRRRGRGESLEKVKGERDRSENRGMEIELR